jgi:membrane protein involved in colicin uptake
MTHQTPPPPRTGQQFNPPAQKRWIARHKVLTGVGVFLALCLIGSAASAAAGHGKPATANKVAASSSYAESVTSATTTSALQAADDEAAAAKAAAEKAAAAAASQAAAQKAAAAKAAAIKAAAAKAAADRAAAVARAAAAAAAAAAAPTTTAPNCTSGYDPCIPPGPDVDCAGGSGNGPRYVQGPVTVTGSDPYGLDADHDGIGCEN